MSIAHAVLFETRKILQNVTVSFPQIVATLVVALAVFEASASIDAGRYNPELYDYGDSGRYVFKNNLSYIIIYSKQVLCPLMLQRVVLKRNDSHRLVTIIFWNLHNALL